MDMYKDRFDVMRVKSVEFDCMYCTIPVHVLGSYDCVESGGVELLCLSLAMNFCHDEYRQTLGQNQSSRS